MNSIEQANQLVGDFSEKEATSTIKRAEREIRGEACGCPSCIKTYVTEANLWLEWLDPERKFKRFVYFVNEQGKLQGKEVEGWEWEFYNE